MLHNMSTVFIYIYWWLPWKTSMDGKIRGNHVFCLNSRNSSQKELAVSASKASRTAHGPTVKIKLLQAGILPPSLYSTTYIMYHHVDIWVTCPRILKKKKGFFFLFLLTHKETPYTCTTLWISDAFTEALYLWKIRSWNLKSQTFENPSLKHLHHW